MRGVACLLGFVLLTSIAGGCLSPDEGKESPAKKVPEVRYGLDPFWMSIQEFHPAADVKGTISPTLICRANASAFADCSLRINGWGTGAHPLEDSKVDVRLFDQEASSQASCLPKGDTCEVSVVVQRNWTFDRPTEEPFEFEIEVTAIAYAAGVPIDRAVFRGWLSGSFEVKSDDES